ncbi:Zinc-dependent alcohol dehydrogenase family protein [Rhodovastum atsumiense]|uniref:Zinc-dependent alcohol dehydrogenase family protein n=1 Tax=Rhodovastum atsumiense TaxID=504468 RepID=A0A5M6IQQ0_9PROT|nr:zinc-dependent alcohol dehydrogenase family protein [Rhodovastum atsumiense]KAA5610257.1 zinc-dependent alcohol dehydrogenase family protein [Rhodovastum atsumiense]CAH2602258.1 Zinc-dependent alcohol dehydrogenase family protein [Rhodovastum atsumiense]
MRAQVLRAHGGAGNFELVNIPEPELRPGAVRVRIAAASVNQIDIKIRDGLPIGPTLPAVLGCDLAGVVEAVGPGVAGFAVGDEVYGCAGGVRGQGGTLAEAIVADARLLAPKPRALSMREAAALPLVTITAWEALERAGVSEADHVLVHGGAGGVGHIGVQLAKARGARVATTVGSAEDAAIARELGADATIDYRQEAVADYVARLTGGRGFDVVFDTVGGANLDRSFAAAALGGRVAAIAARSTHDLSPLHAKGLSLHVVFMLIPMLHDIGRERHGQLLREAAALVEAGTLRPLLDPARFDLAAAADAYRHLESGQACGKVVIDIA